MQINLITNINNNNNYKMISKTTLLVISLFFAVTLAVKGVDTQFSVSLSQMKCIKENTLEGTLK